jgi:hypothetical protein
MTDSDCAPGRKQSTARDRSVVLCAEPFDEAPLRCPLLALLRPTLSPSVSPILHSERTYRGHREIDAIDPKWTSWTTVDAAPIRQCAFHLLYSFPNSVNVRASCRRGIRVYQIISAEFRNKTFQHPPFGVWERAAVGFEAYRSCRLVDRVSPEIGEASLHCACVFVWRSAQAIISCKLRAIRAKDLPRKVTVVREDEETVGIRPPERVSIRSFGVG